ncbi:MAG: methyltransferase domain-containing protein [Rhodospirillaceae bacterium]|jgi:NADH dehydrogenase [ubiquinone] 1 alpha subcomplex assembly factor 5|nr:methyltransferase domain-containing protein [Rhodospirillaceae bacterium]
MAETMTVFNRRAVRQHRDRAAADLTAHDFLFAETAERLADRLDDVKRAFPLALDLGCHGGELSRALNSRGGIETLACADLSERMAKQAGTPALGPSLALALAADEEALPFAAASLDLVLSNLSLHWVNDLPGALVQIRQALKPDGLFLASMLGGATLHELRTALYEAEIEVEGGLSPRFSPFADVRDLGNLLQRAGFALPVADFETITVSYETPLKLLRDLRGMGETNANSERRRTFSRRATLFKAMEIYMDRFAGPDGRVPASFEVITMTAWAPAPDQPKPLAPGSGATPLGDAV